MKLKDLLILNTQSQLYADQRVGADPHIVPHHLWLKWEADLQNKFLVLQRINNNLIDLIWDVDRPPRSQVTIKIQPTQYSGERWQDKVTELRRRLKHLNCDAMIITSLTEIAYLLNIRGRDIPYTPVVKVSSEIHFISLYNLSLCSPT